MPQIVRVKEIKLAGDDIKDNDFGIIDNKLIKKHFSPEIKGKNVKNLI